MATGPVPVVDPTTRSGLHLVAAHVLGRRRYEVAGRFGLRAAPGGFATPAFGPEPEVLRVAGTDLVREVGAGCAALPVAGATLRELAAFAGTGVGGGYSAGADTPALPDPDAPLTVHADGAAALAGWYALAWRVLDAVLAPLPASAEPATIQLWPEHFDAGTNVGVGGGERVNLGFSPGDSFSDQPYVYVGPWSAARPGDPDYWNAPFGALLGAADVWSAPDPARRCVEFVRAGLRHASGGRA